MSVAMAAAKRRPWWEEAEAILREADTRLRVERDAPLAKRTSLGVGGPARLLLEPERPEDLAPILRRFTEAGVPFEYLGAGSNLLVADAGPSFVVVATEALDAEPVVSGTTMRAGAGYPVPKLVKRAFAARLSGIEFAEGIPGSVGGAVRMNAGWHEGMFGAAVASITTLTRAGAIEEIPATASTFVYRGSPGVGDRLVTGATLRLAPEDPERIKERMREYREHRLTTQPTGAKNAGCIFRNPPGGHAGRLIDESGLKGTARGRAVVSPIHANFIINQGGAGAADVLALIDLVRETVLRRTGVTLEREVILWS